MNEKVNQLVFCFLYVTVSGHFPLQLISYTIGLRVG